MIRAGKTNIATVQISSEPRFVSRVFTDVSGRKFRLTFLVALVNGEIRGKLVSAEPLPSNYRYQIAGDVSDKPYCLPISCSQKKPNSVYIVPKFSFVSPYFSLEFLINSQPTRAPSTR